MAWITFYRKYRPQRLKELDLTDLGSQLLKLVKAKKVPHALLFTGPRGMGKTSAARIIAKAVNCLKLLPSGEPCNRCAACLAITNGTALDLIEIDAASNRGIDDIRLLKEKIGLAPVQYQYKVYIIDEVHMLTTEAFNALLKTLEEPPAHALFILCTTALNKLPETIVSRCLRFNFRKANVGELVGSLKKIVKGEKLTISQQALETIARSVDGSFRDGQKILEQLAAAGKKISLKQVQQLLGQLEELRPGKLLNLLADRQAKEALKEIDRVVQSGGELGFYLEQILDWLRRALLVQAGLDEVEAPVGAEKFTPPQIHQLISLFSQAAQQSKTAFIPQLPLEVAIVEYCSLPLQPAPKNPQPSSVPGNGKKANPVLKQIENNWAEILTQIKPMNHSVEALLKASRPIKVDGTTLILEVFYQFHKERLETEKCRRIVEEVVGTVLGNPLKLKCVLGEKPKAEESDIIKVANQIFNGQLVEE